MAVDQPITCPDDDTADALLNMGVAAFSERTVCVYARGEVDAHTVSELGRSLRSVPLGRTGCVLDLTAVTFFGTAGVRLLNDWYTVATASGVTVAIVLRGTALRTALRLLDRGTPIPQFATTDQAAAYVEQNLGAARGSAVP